MKSLRKDQEEHQTFKPKPGKAKHNELQVCSINDYRILGKIVVVAGWIKWRERGSGEVSIHKK